MGTTELGMSEAEFRRLLDEVTGDPDELAVLLAGGVPLSLRRWLIERAVARADEKVPGAPGRDEIVEHARRLILHPAASEHLDTAIDLFAHDVPLEMSLAALGGLAGAGGSGTPN